MSKRLRSALAVMLLTALGVTVGSTALAAAAPVNGGGLKNGKPVDGVSATPDGTAFTFKAVFARHLTVNVTQPNIAPAGARLQLRLYASNGNQITSTQTFSSDPIQVDFTPTATQAGKVTAVVSPSDTGATGSFTIAYANDVDGGTLSNGVASTGKTKFPGQRIDFTMTTVAGRHVTFNLTRPHVAPAGARLQMRIYAVNGNQITSTKTFSTDAIQTDFTPSAAQAGTTRINVSPYDVNATGSFTITYADDVKGGKLTDGVPTTKKTKFPGQRVSFTFTAVFGRHLTVNVTHPHVLPAAARLQMRIYNADGNQITSTKTFSTDPVQTDFTPSATQAGTVTVVVSPYDTNATGSFTITYANDIDGGELTAGRTKMVRTTFPGQRANFSFEAAAGQPVTVSITKPHVTPAGAKLQMRIYGSNGGQVANTETFGTDPVAADFTPSAAQAGTLTIVVSPYDLNATGKFRIGYVIG